MRNKLTTFKALISDIIILGESFNLPIDAELFSYVHCGFWSSFSNGP